jgi:hypothetical protein
MQNVQSKHHTILKNRMAVLRNRYPPNIPSAGADPLLKFDLSPNPYCILGHKEIMDVGTVSFR